MTGRTHERSNGDGGGRGVERNLGRSSGSAPNAGGGEPDAGQPVDLAPQGVAGAAGRPAAGLRRLELSTIRGFAREISGPRVKVRVVFAMLRGQPEPPSLCSFQP